MSKFISNKNLPQFALFLLGFLLYANTIPFDYALDDKLYVTHNQFTTQGFQGIKDLVTNDLLVGFYGKDKGLLEGGRYRPLPLLTWAIEYQIVGENPSVSHFINALLYGIISVLVFLVVRKMWRHSSSEKWYWSFPFVAAALYSAHPLHTEIAANIKGRVEMMMAVFGLLSLLYSLKYYDTQKIKYAVVSGAMIFLSFASKESAVNFLGIIPLTLIFFREFDLKKLLASQGIIWVFSAAFLGIRFAMLGNTSAADVPAELMNENFMYANLGERYATILLTWGLYIKLLFFPHPLTHDYYPWHPLTTDKNFDLSSYPYPNWTDIGVLISGVVMLALLVLALKGLKKRSVYSYGTLLFFGSFILYSNLVFDIGTFMNERFMFIPSLGFCIIIAYVLTQELQKLWTKNLALKGIFVVVLLAFSVKTISRNNAWENDNTLALTDVKTSVNSAKANMGAGNALVEMAAEERNFNKRKRLASQAAKHLERSLELHPKYFDPLVLLGNAYVHLKEYPSAISWHEKALKVNPQEKHATNNLIFLGDTLTKSNQIDLAILSLETLVKIQPNLKAYSKLGELYGRYKNQFPKAEEYLIQARKMAPNDTDVLIKLGTVKAMQQNFDEAIEIFSAAEKIQPNNHLILQNLALAYNAIGEKEKAAKYFKRAQELAPKSK